MNDKIPLGGETAKLSESSWNEYINQYKVKEKICLGKDIILGQFDSVEDYKKFAISSLEDIRENKKNIKI